MKMPVLLAALAIATPAAAPALAAPAPRVSITTIDQLAQPLPYPYDEQADAKAAVAKAKAQAKREHKKLLIDFGGNWCPDCRILAGIIALPEVKSFVEKHFVEVTVNIGRYDKNGDIAAHYGFPDRLKGVPTVLIVDPRTDQVINKDKTFALTDARHMSPQALADWLAQWTA